MARSALLVGCIHGNTHGEPLWVHSVSKRQREEDDWFTKYRHTGVILGTLMMS